LASARFGASARATGSDDLSAPTATTTAADRPSDDSMHLVLTVPGLVEIVRATDVAAPSLQHLARLIAAAGEATREADGIIAAIAPNFGVTRQIDWPMAPLRLAVHGVDPGDAYWLAADPVTLIAGRDDAQVGAAVRDLDATETASLVATLNAHFAGDGLRFVAPRPDAWFVCAPNVPSLSTRPLVTAKGRSLRTQMPTGADAKTWWRWQEEIQMLLFAHDVTAAREREGKASVNGLWLSEGGTRPASPAAPPSIATFGDDDAVRALAAHAGTAALALPANFDHALAQAKDAAIVVVAFAAPADVAAIDRDFAAPAAAALARGTLERVTVIADDRGSARAWSTGRPSWPTRIANRFRPPAIAALLGAMEDETH
jgi:hypothetical protein